MSMVEFRHQKSTLVERVAKWRGETTRDAISDETEAPRQTTRDTGPGLLEQALARENLQRAWSV